MIYFARLRSVDMVKIGFTSRSPERRLAELCRDFGADIELIGISNGYPHHEKMLHRQFASMRLPGEVFRAEEALLAYAEAAAARYPVGQLLGFAGDDLVQERRAA